MTEKQINFQHLQVQPRLVSVDKQLWTQDLTQHNAVLQVPKMF